jgi:predicted amidohydrolase YtcJ
VLIRNAEVWGKGLTSLRIADGKIAEVGQLSPRAGEQVIEARGGALLPGLHDHHIHLAGLAARRASVWCGPPEVTRREELADALAQPGTGWLRAIGYHESVLGGLPDAEALDALCPHRPLRMQHRSGRMWLLNSRALEELLAKADPPPGLEREGGRYTGRLFDEDAWLRKALGSSPPDCAEVSQELARCGVTGVTDMTPQNGPEIAAHFAQQQTSGAMLQTVLLAGTQALDTHGPVKLHLHEAALPDFDETVRAIAMAHESARAIAVHCVSEVELVFALAAIEQAGARRGDRIEHASVASPELVGRMAALGLWVCVQPHFIAERGDQYLADVEPRHVPDLYRLRSLADAGLPLSGGSDAPFASADPWEAMRASIRRKTSSGAAIGPDEAISPEAALSLYLADPHDFTKQRPIEPGAPADLCLLSRPWSKVRERLTADDVNTTFVSGRLVYNRVDQP